ncbi:MAG: gas vesicle protein GvpG [Acidobacteriaceae bacterium]
MLLVDDILLSPVHSILWVFREIGKIAQKELAGEATSITEQLRILYMQLETGRITEAEFNAGEKLLLDRLDAIESRREDEDGTEEPDEDEDEEPEVVGRVAGKTPGNGRPV